jgi:transcriptional regulator with XRE-family HTH domain
MGPPRKAAEVEEIVARIRKKMKPWGITVSYLAEQLAVSRQYAWQIVHYRTFLSGQRAREIENAVDRIIAQRTHITTFGRRLRAARISAGYTLKEVAGMIGYSWVGVERWEKDLCLPKPGVLWHLANLYGAGAGWVEESGAIPSMAHLQPGGGRVFMSFRQGAHEELARALQTGPALFGPGGSHFHQHGKADTTPLGAAAGKRAKRHVNAP